MNPLTNTANLKKLTEREIELGIAGTNSSWHNIYKDSAWIFVGGLPYDLTEGDIICVFSQYGEIVNINVPRDKKTGKTKGFAFICYEDQRSTILAVDNFNGAKLLQRTIRVDHVKDYKPPDLDDKNIDDITRKVRAEGVAPKPILQDDEEDDDLLLPLDEKEKKKKYKKEKKVKKEKNIKKEPPSPMEEADVSAKGKHKASVKVEKEDKNLDKINEKLRKDVTKNQILKKQSDWEARSNRSRLSKSRSRSPKGRQNHTQRSSNPSRSGERRRSESRNQPPRNQRRSWSKER